MSHWLQRIGQSDADTFASLIAKLGNNTTAFWAAIGYEGATSLAAKLTAARAALLDQITAARLAELDAANIPADIDTLLTRLTAARAGYLDNINQAGLLSLTALRAGYLDNLSAGAAALAAVCTAARLAELDAANIPADVDTLLARLTALRAGYLDNLSAGATSLRASQLRELYQMDFWSNPQEEVSIPAVAATLALPSVTVADLPAGATVVRAFAMLKFRAIENTNAAANTLSGATVAATSQVIQVQNAAAGTWRDAINFVNLQFGVAASTREGGDALVGSIDIANEVTANGTYSFRYLLALAALAALNWNDCQTGLKIWFSV